GGNTTLTANGGTNFVWSNSNTNPSITVTAGTYSVTASDASGCTGTNSVTVVENPSPAITVAGILTYCVGTSTTITANGGQTYVWSTSETTPSITVSQGNYTVTG